MKYLLIMIMAASLVGCDNTAELAPNNLKKGDKYFSEKDYEVAQYYYEKIPDSSPLYKEAQMKLQKIAEITAGTLPKVSAEDEVQKVSIFDQKITSNADGKAPIHSVVLNNESTHKLLSVEFEFTYFDDGGNVIAVKKCTIEKSMPSKSQETYSGIAPGVLDVPCVSTKVRVISAEFQ